MTFITEENKMADAWSTFGKTIGVVLGLGVVGGLYGIGYVGYERGYDKASAVANEQQTANTKSLKEKGLLLSDPSCFRVTNDGQTLRLSSIRRGNCPELEVTASRYTGGGSYNGEYTD